MKALPAGVWRRATRQTSAIGQVSGSGPIARSSIGGPGCSAAERGITATPRPLLARPRTAAISVHTATWEPEQHLHGPFDQYDAPISFFAPGQPRGLFLGDYMGLETIEGDDVINFFTSTISDGADARAIRADHP
jgi:hypothetical protein